MIVGVGPDVHEDDLAGPGRAKHPGGHDRGGDVPRGSLPADARQITAVTGKSPLPLFRFPFGDADARTIAIANQAEYVPVRWTVDTLAAQSIAAAGFRIGDRTVSHPYLTRLSDAAVRQEILDAS